MLVGCILYVICGLKVWVSMLDLGEWVVVGVVQIYFVLLELF